MQADVEVVIPRGDYDIVRHEVAVLMRDFLMVAWTQNNHVAIWPGCHSGAGNFPTVASDRIAVAASGWIAPIPIRTVG